MSILAFKDVHPEAEIIAFEPDHEIAQILRENLRTNSISGVTVVEAGLSGVDGTARFRPDNSAGGQIVESSEGECVPTERLSKFLDRHVDFVKLNIEGQELPVLEELEATGKLSNVQEIVLEYHGWPNSQQHLGDILNLLARNRFRYLVHDFDNETCPQTKPPFRMRDDIPWFCLVYACRQNG